MKHIRQINSIEEEKNSYTIVKDVDNLYENHPAMLEHPERFEVVDTEIPEEVQYLNYK